jgi:tRNA G18 (ribose-2'-O)-methylase SpoU
MRSIILIAHNLRSCHNVGSLLRTAEGLGVHKVILTGYTPYPLMEHDIRLPYIAQKMHKQISKTALGAETSQEWLYAEDIEKVIKELKADGCFVMALEQTRSSVPLPEFTSPKKVAIIVGREVEGVEPEVIELCDGSIEIPMFGQKESFNVVQAAAMCLYHIRFQKL